MKTIRRRAIRPGSGEVVSLFPFLAVLICTMGALIVLLVVMVRQVRLDATQGAAAAFATDTAITVEEAHRLAEELDWQFAQLTASREETQEQLADARLKLGHTEDHIRKLRESLAHRQDELKQTISTADEQVDLESLQRHLERLQADVAEAKAEMEKAREAVRNRAYAIIPYDGRHGTKRRPIYLECRADAVVLQPEGIRFTASDFAGSLGPGNPLDAALRAVREHWQSSSPDNLPLREPYPLLLVRPSGIESYYAARAAMTSWGSEFGYELIEEDWELAFPAPDPLLAQTVFQTVSEARRRMRLLAQVAPRKYGNSLALGNDFSSEGGAPRNHTSTAGEAVPLSTGQPRRQNTDAGATGTDSGGGPSPRPFANATNGRSGNAEGTSLVTGAGGSDLAERVPHGPVASPVAPSNDRGDSASSQGVPPSGQSNRGSMELRQPSADPATSAANPAAASYDIQPLARTRGANWGLPQRTERGMAVTRPVRVDCHADHLTVAASEGTQSAQTIRLDGPLAEHADALVSAVWDEVESWGIAGYGMYWKPVLSVRVAPDGETRFRELQILLEGSGLGVERADSR